MSLIVTNGMGLAQKIIAMGYGGETTAWLDRRETVGVYSKIMTVLTETSMVSFDLNLVSKIELVEPPLSS